MQKNKEKEVNVLLEEADKCFVIMPISDQGEYPKGHFSKVYEQIFKPAILEAGYEPYRVDEDKISNPIINKIFDAVQNCPMALCDLSNRNPNVLYELGLRQAYDKPVVLVQDEKTPRIFDVSGINTIQYSSERLYENVIEAWEKITDAIISTKEGKANSLVKIVQAESAVLKEGEVSKEDRMEVMLNSLMSEMKEIRNLTDKTSYEKSYETSIYPEGRFITNEKRNNPVYSEIIWPKQDTYKYLVKLKQGVTSKEIEQALNKIRNNGLKVKYMRNGNELVVEGEMIYSVNEKMMLQEILEKLGVVVPFV